MRAFMRATKAYEITYKEKLKEMGFCRKNTLQTISGGLFQKQSLAHAVQFSIWINSPVNIRGKRESAYR